LAQEPTKARLMGVPATSPTATVFSTSVSGSPTIGAADPRSMVRTTA
jgi:hypothetical protein